ncbi:MAG TPA: carboxymuconolactone decarboxylase family protein [Gaiellaceae bacterium]|nr:carboxymuconolactone decarboxylase family protein [Gaiellaceae bacterium]
MSDTLNIPVRLDVDAHAASFMQAMSRLDGAAAKELDRVSFDARLRELVRLRASQLNGCAYCVNMHAANARAAGETEQRLALVAVWPEAGLFTEREQAALALTEAVTLCAQEHVPGTVWEAAAAVFSPDELGALVALIVTINAWNAIGVTTRAWPVAPATT